MRPRTWCRTSRLLDLGGEGLHGLYASSCQGSQLLSCCSGSFLLPFLCTCFRAGETGPTETAAGTATALVAVLFLITFLGVSVRKPVVTTASSIIVVVFLSNLIMMGLT